MYQNNWVNNLFVLSVLERRTGLWLIPLQEPKQVPWFTALLKLQRQINSIHIISLSIFWKKSPDTWMTMVWISVKICFLGRTSCQRNAGNFNDIPLFGAIAYVGVPTMEPLRWMLIREPSAPSLSKKITFTDFYSHTQFEILACDTPYSAARSLRDLPSSRWRRTIFFLNSGS